MKSPQWLDAAMNRLTQQIVSLSETLQNHEGIGHWAVSMRITSKGDFIHRLKNNADIRTGTYLAALQKFSDIWPDDLEWPADIPRPTTKEVAA